MSEANKEKSIAPNIFLENPTVLEANKEKSIAPNIFLENPTVLEANKEKSIVPNIFLENPTVLAQIFDSKSRSFSLQRVKDIIKSENSFRALKLQARKELCHAAEKAQDEDNLEESTTQLHEECDQLHRALIKHQLFVDTFQESAFQAQMQRYFQKYLRETGEEVIKPEVRSALRDFNENLSLSSEMAQELNETTKLEKSILKLRFEHRELLSSVEEKWKILDGPHSQKTVENDPKNPLLDELEERVTRRQDRLCILINILRNLISCSGERWGANPTLVEIMLLCDAASRHIEGNEDISEILTRLKIAKGTKERPEVFVSSTPDVTKRRAKP